MLLTVRSNGRPGLKYFGMSLKEMTYGDSTILMPVFSASTRSLPAQENISSQTEVKADFVAIQKKIPLGIFTIMHTKNLFFLIY